MPLDEQEQQQLNEAVPPCRSPHTQVYINVYGRGAGRQGGGRDRRLQRYRGGNGAGSGTPRRRGRTGGPCRGEDAVLRARGRRRRGPGAGGEDRRYGRSLCSSDGRADGGGVRLAGYTGE